MIRLKIVSSHASCRYAHYGVTFGYCRNYAAGCGNVSRYGLNGVEFIIDIVIRECLNLTTCTIGQDMIRYWNISSRGFFF